VKFYWNTFQIFDLRQIPLILSGLYGGFLPLLFSFFILIGFRFYIGGEGAFGALYVNLILLATILIIIHLIKHRKNKFNRVGSAVGLSLLGSFITVFIYSFYTFKPFVEYVDLFLSHTFIQGIGILMLCIVIETIIGNKIIQDKLMSLEKMQSISHLAASISHEVRNPLTVVRGFTQLFSENNLTPDKRKEYTALVLQELDRAELIISNYLQFAKPELEDVRDLNINKEIESITKIMEPFAAKEGVNLNTEFNNNGDVLYIIGDSGLFRQCMLNIIKNAIEATPTNGTVNVFLTKKGNNINIEIKDTGVGMSKEQLRRLGEPYFSTKEKGTGLGLMVTFTGIKKMKGEIEIKSEIGSGTSFCITFPKAKTG
jgi:two-component system sporulation sensor kinase B